MAEKQKEETPKTPKKAKQPKADRTYKIKGVLYPEGMELSPEEVKLFDSLKCTYTTQGSCLCTEIQLCFLKVEKLSPMEQTTSTH